MLAVFRVMVVVELVVVVVVVVMVVLLASKNRTYLVVVHSIECPRKFKSLNEGQGVVCGGIVLTGVQV